MDQSIIAGIGTSIARKSYGARQFIPKYQVRQFQSIPLIAFGLMLHISSLSGLRAMRLSLLMPNFSQKNDQARNTIFLARCCPKCNGDVRRLEINKRRAFVSDTCQPLLNHISWLTAAAIALPICRRTICCGGRIWTCDLQVMSQQNWLETYQIVCCHRVAKLQNRFVSPQIYFQRFKITPLQAHYLTNKWHNGQRNQQILIISLTQNCKVAR